MALEENSQGGTTSFGQKPQARGLALWRSFGEGREIALIGPAVTVPLKAQAFSPGFYLIVPGSLSQTRVPLRWLRAFSRQREVENPVCLSYVSIHLFL